MYRLQTNFSGEYQVRDLDRETFAQLVTTGLFVADQEAQARHPDSLVVYTAVWNPDANQYVSQVPVEEIDSAYVAWRREAGYP